MQRMNSISCMVILYGPEGYLNKLAINASGALALLFKQVSKLTHQVHSLLFKQVSKLTHQVHSLCYLNKLAS